MSVLHPEERQSNLIKHPAHAAGLKHIRNLLLVSWLVLALPLSASAQEVAGRVISTVGEVLALRPEDSERVLGRGDEVYVGDRLITAENGRAQIRFIDDGLVDIRPDSEFEVVEYQESDDGESGSAAMEFTAGALRTITGRIGNRPGDDYNMSTDVASIGIRGTDYSLQLCDFECAENNQPEGLYGRVDDGVVAITNQAGTTEFSQNQYFFVENEELMPQLLPSAPQNILDGSEDGETAEDDTDDDTEDDSDAVEVAEPDEETDDDTTTEAEVTVESAFVAADANLLTEDDIQDDDEVDTDPEPDIEPVTRVMAGSYQYSNTFFGGLIRVGTDYSGSFETVKNNDGRPFLDTANFPDGWDVSTENDPLTIEVAGEKTFSDGSSVYWGIWYSNGLTIMDPDDESFDTYGGEFFHIFSEDVTTPQQLSDITGTLNYTGVENSMYVESYSETFQNAQDWAIENISIEVNFSDSEINNFNMNMSDGNDYELEVAQSDAIIENLHLVDFEFTGDWDYTYVDNPSSGDVSGNFSGQLIGETADGMIFSIDMERLGDESELLEEILASGLLEANRD